MIPTKTYPLSAIMGEEMTDKERISELEAELTMRREQAEGLQNQWVKDTQKIVALEAEADAMEEFLSAAARYEKQASAIINSLTADIHITVPLRDYTTMSPKDCYELGMMDSVAALKAQINAAIDAALEEKK